ncbi:hypothetical protein FJ651_15465 [Paucihalobacter ruber]|uniref:Uncharacterized protein n=2 Tax=Paucihalobacter ruber TaxID=2567861 RepID=A0A506PFR0_9FLAO|nr:hypothetical protein FJ651_15465 [Paucihalobacter ruber]
MPHDAIVRQRGIVFYFYLENSSVIPELVEVSNKLRYKGFVTFFLAGLVKYGLLVVGIGMIIILSFMLIKKKLKEQIKK